MKRTRLLGVIAAALTLTPWLVDCDRAQAQQRGMRKGKYICSVPGVGDLPLKTSRMLKDEHFFVYPTYGKKAQVSCEFSGSLQSRVWCPEGTVPANLNNLPPCLLVGQESLKMSANGNGAVDFDPNEEPGKRGLALSKEIKRLEDLIKRKNEDLKKAEDQFNQECVQKAGDAKRCEELKKDIDQYKDFLMQAPIEIEMLKEELMGLQFRGFDVLAKQCRERLRTISANALSKVRPPKDKPCIPLELKEVEEQPAIDEDQAAESDNGDAGTEEPGDTGNPENPDAPGYRPGGAPQGRPKMLQIGDE